MASLPQKALKMNQADRRGRRAFLDQCESEAMTAYDTTAVTLSGGALAIALAFVKDVPDPRWRWLFPLSLLALTVSVLSVLLSHLTSAKSMRYEIECLDRGTDDPDERSGGSWRTQTEFLNWTTLVGCVLGIALLAAFVTLNMWRGSPMSKRQEPNTSQRPAEQSDVNERGRVTPDRPVATTPRPAPTTPANQQPKDE